MLQYFAALNRLEKLTPLRFLRLLKYFHDDAQRIWDAPEGEWIEAGIEPKAAFELANIKKTLNPDEELIKLEKIRVKILPITSEKYPSLLREIYDPPPVLLVRGEFPIPEDDFGVAVVGSRAVSQYGKQVTVELTRPLAQAGVTIVSGLALGVDALAHQTALDFGARTVAVLGNGIDQIYPSSNRRLAEEILEKGGAIISEFSIGTEPTNYNFPQRNRIIAGLSRGVLVTEAREKSGALITASLALDANREVFAVPGSIFSETSAGTNRLIQQGARPITRAEDILEAMNFGNLLQKVQVQKVVANSPEEARILQVLKKEPLHTDELIRLTALSVSKVSSLLSLLEMKGMVRNLGGMQWVRV
jgi:DNA processing protein